jgi:hypothetical protein
MDITLVLDGFNCFWRIGSRDGGLRSGWFRRFCRFMGVVGAVRGCFSWLRKWLMNWWSGKLLFRVFLNQLFSLVLLSLMWGRLFIWLLAIRSFLLLFGNKFLSCFFMLVLNIELFWLVSHVDFLFFLHFITNFIFSFRNWLILWMQFFVLLNWS